MDAFYQLGLNFGNDAHMCLPRLNSMIRNPASGLYMAALSSILMVAHTGAEQGT